MKPIVWKQIIFALGISIVATAAFADDNDNMSSTNPAPITLLTSQQFVSDAAMGGMKEIFLSELALQQSQDARIQAFAKRMVKDHSAANKKLMEIAEGEGLDFPATNTFSTDDPNWSNQMISNSENLKGAEMLTMTNLPYVADYRSVQNLKLLNDGQFDQAYVNDMLNDHVQTVSEFERASQNLSDPKLKKFAEKTLPTLRRHLKMARELAVKYGGAQETNPNTDTNNSVPSQPMPGAGL